MIAAKMKWPLYQQDVNNSFLHGDQDVEIYTAPPLGMERPSTQVLKLQNSIYGLRQAS